MRLAARLGITAALVLVSLARAEGLHAQIIPEVFAPATVSVEGQSLYRGAFSPDGTDFYFFRKVTEGEEDYRIFVSHRQGDQWETATRVDLGGEYSDLYPTISPDGRRMVFTSYRPAPGDTSAHPNANLWYADRAGSGWGTPVYMAAASTQANYDAGPEYQEDGSVLFVSTEPDWRTRHHRATRWEGRRFGPHSSGTGAARRLDPWRTWRSGEVRIWGGNPSRDGTFMILGVSELRDGRPLESDLYVAFRDGDRWTDPQPLEGVNTPGTENFMVFSPDGRDFLFVRDFATYYRIPVSQIRSLR